MTARRRRHLALVFGVALGATLPTSAAAQAAYSGSVTFLRSRADGTTRADAIYIVNGFDAPIGRVRASVTVPMIAQQMPTATDAVSAAATNWVTGLGDVYVRADVPLSGVGSGRLATSVNGAVKLPTADAARGLGSGETDVTIGFAVSSMRGRHSVLADVSFWMLGDSQDVEVRNVPAVFVGYGIVLDRAYRWSAVFAAAASASIIDGLPAPAQVSVGVLRVLRSGAGLGVTVGVGLTDSAAAFTVGTNWRIVF